ncbi:DUF6503 family protein [Psychroserpens sp.]|uniref:DUF6503 family protein n=1 Tax=Psychroserpens sp. TaxID=2020870 RepID=UPI00385CAC6E
MKYILVSVFATFLLNCKNLDNEQLSAEFIINKSIQISGSEKVGISKIGFDFRDKYYYADRDKGKFMLMRMTIENNKDSIFDVLSNDGFERHINTNEAVFVEDSMKVNYSASVNSVHYFSVLPYGLNDKAVNKKRLDDVVINNEKHYAIKVTFHKEGGGEDYEDVFVYWINSESFKLGYLAYSYNEIDGKGMRFREAYNERFINDIRFLDYNNYKPNDKIKTLKELPKLFEDGALTLLSKIELKNIKVN